MPDLINYEVKELYNYPIEKLCHEYLTKKIPVIFWASIDMKLPKKTKEWINPDTQEKVIWKSPMHCLLLTGYDDQYYYFNDPLRGKNISYTKDIVNAAYQQMYCQALVISKS